MEKINFFNDKRVLVMGLGRFGGGVDVVKFAHKTGAKVTVTDLSPPEKLPDSINYLKDLKGIDFHLGKHIKEDFEAADVIIANPAVRPDNEFLQVARKNKKIITSQIEIFFQLCPAKIIGITGSNGKSTTAALTAHLLKAASDELRATRYGKIYLTGNIGNQPMLCLLENIETSNLVVLEISSFQLEQLAQIKKAPHISLLTNLTPNHLDRHKTFENYCDTKETIFKHQKLDEKNPAVSVFAAEDEIADRWYEKYKKQAGRICFKFSADAVTNDIKNCFKLPGRANLSNLAAALAIVKYFGVTDEQLKPAVSTFKTLPHRLRLVAEKNGVRWYNDSKATTPESAIAALQSFDEPIILIAGGYDKNISFDELGVEIARKAKAAILIGRTAPKIETAVKNAQKYLAPSFTGGSRDKRYKTRPKRSQRIRNTKIQFANSLQQAVNLANQLAQPGDIVLLSPACASYDMFDNYRQRGSKFTRLVSKLKANE